MSRKTWVYRGYVGISATQRPLLHALAASCEGDGASKIAKLLDVLEAELTKPRGLIASLYLDPVAHAAIVDRIAADDPREQASRALDLIIRGISGGGESDAPATPLDGDEEAQSEAVTQVKQIAKVGFGGLAQLLEDDGDDDDN